MYSGVRTVNPSAAEPPSSEARWAAAIALLLDAAEPDEGIEPLDREPGRAQPKSRPLAIVKEAR